MAVNDFVRRSIQIVGGGIAQSTTDYFDNAISFVNDVKEVIDMGKQMGSDGAKKFNELKSSNILKKTRDWFYNEGGMFGDFDFDDDDFDAGFEIESADSENSGESPKPLSKDMMTDIAKKQTGAMYKAFGRQADLHIANTAEIISTINTRTAELTASVNNVNNTLIQIGKRLDLIVEWTSARVKKEEAEKRQAGILDYGGGISLTGVVNKAKENAEDSMIGTFLNMGKTMLGSGMMTPEMVMSTILSQTILDKKWDKLGKKSINDIGEFINDTVDEVVQNTLTKVLTTKNEMLSSLFEDIITKAGGKNYQNSVVNQYNDKPAVFDGMTRKSIVTVIPGYLNEILKAVSKDGIGREIDKKGNLIKQKTDSFVNEVADSYFRSGTMESKQREKASERTSLDTQTISDAVRTLTGCWTWEFYKSGNIVLKIGEVKNLNYESTARVVKNAAYLMSTKTKYSEDQWMNFYMGILEEIDEFKYRQELQRIADRADKNLEEFAKNSLNNHQARRINPSVLEAAFEKNWGDFSHNDEILSSTSESTSTKSTSVKPTQIGSIGNVGITDLDYMAGIFDRLNRGLNVFITGQNLNNRDHQYKKIRMIPGYAARKARSGSDTASDDPDSGGAKNVVKDIADKIQSAQSYSEKAKANMDEATREAFEAEERGEELSKEQKKLIKTYEKENSFGGKFKKGLVDFIHTSQREGIIPDPEIYNAISDATDSFKKWWDDIKPEKLKKGEEFIKNTEIYKTIVNSRQLESIKKAGADVKDKATNIAFGNEQLNDDGSISRSGGIIQKGIGGFSKLIGNTANKIDDEKIAVSNKLATTKTLENRTNELLKDYGPDKTFDESNTDAIQMQLISSEMNVAMSNGDYSNIDNQTISQAISKIQDKDLRRQLKQSVIPLLKRNGKSIEGTKETSNDKGVFGKVATLVKGGIKMILKPVVGYIKIVIGSVFVIIKKGVGTIVNFAKKRIKHALVSMKAGVKSLGHGVVRMFKSMTAVAKKAVDITFSVANKINSVVKNVTPYFKAFGKKLLGISEMVFGKKYKDENVQKTEDTSDEKKKGFIDKAKEKLSGVGDKFAKTSFAQGFMKATKERKEAQAKAKLKEEAAPIKEGIETSEIGKDLKDALEAEDGKKGFFKKLITLVQGIFDKTPDQSEQNPTEDENGKNISTETTGDENITDTKESTENEKTNRLTSDIDGKKAVSEGGTKKGFFGKIKDTVKGGVSNILGGIGEAVGGLAGMMGGLLEMVLSIVMSMEGFKTLTNLVMEILKSSLEPLNDAFQMITKVLKPILKQIGGIIKQLAEFIVVIVDAVVDVIKPIISDVVKPVLEVVAPLLQSIIGCLTPLLKIVGILLKVIMAPLMGLFKFVLLPIIKVIGDTVQIIMGVLQIGFGVVMMALGGIIAGIGGIITGIGKIIPGLSGELGSGILDVGKGMMSQGTEFVVQGGKAVGQGVVNYVLDTSSLFTLGATDALVNRNEGEKKEKKTIETPENSNAIQSTYASGDVANIYGIYGGEYQRGMGGYLNMNQRGCGPIALADMYNRNKSGMINARSLAGSMYSSGRYDPHRGTSVADYIDTGRSMGMNLRSGKVTQRSLKSASPTNPITVVGSGPDYGTRKGNNHFMNVIGTDSHGMAFVSNPLTGRIDRKSTSSVVGSSIMGIYGSGDEQDGGYTFPDAIKEAFKKLKNEAAKILGLFSMEKSDEDAVNESINAEKNLYATEQAKKQLGETEYAKIEKVAKDKARADYEKLYPKKDGQSDEEYERKFNEYWDSKSTQYLADAELYNKASENGKNAWATFAATSDKLIDDYVGTTDENGNRSGGLFDQLGKAYSDVNENIKNLGSGSSSGSGGSGYFTSDEGVPLWVPYSDNIQITETDITKGNSNSPLFEFFAKTMGYNLGDVYGSGWFSHYDNPNREGVGSASESHYGVDFTAGGLSGKPLYATTGGKVVSKSYQAGGGGNMLIWQDIAGKYHWYMHMAQPSLLNVGDTIEGGDLIGYAGTTGASTGPHLHYTINDSLVSSGSGNPLNPLMYFKNYNPTGGTLVGGTNEEKIWAYLTSHGFEKHAAAGVMGAFQVESGNDPDTLEGYYAFDDGSRHNPTVEAALKSYDSLDHYVTSKLFPYYDRSGSSINKSGYRGTDGHYYPGLGLAQWTGPRTKSLGEYTVGKGLQWNDLTGQLDYLKHELDVNSRYNAAVRSMNNSNDVNTATSIWLSDFEGNPGDKLAERQKYANDFYLRYKNWTPETPQTFTVNGSGSTSTGFGLVNSVSDARRQDNYNQIKSTDGKNTGIVNTESGDLNMRSGKGIDSSVLITIPNETRLNLEASGSPGWYKTTFGGKTGYVSSAYILLDNDDANNFSYSANTESPTGPYQLEDMIKNNNTISNSSTQYPQQVSISKTTNIDHSNDAQWYQVNGKWTKDDKVFGANDPRWRSAWYNETSPRHYSEFSPAFSSLEHMVTIATNPSLRNGEYYNNLIDEYGGGQSGLYSVQSMYDDLGDSEGWKASRDDYIKKSKTNRRSSAFVQDLQALHNAYWPSKKLSLSEMETRVKGSGDADTILTEDAFWNNYLGWNNNHNSNISIPMSDGSDTAYSNDTYYDTENGTSVVNNYTVTRAEDKETDARLKAILANTYNVRSESMEALLNAILEELRKRKDPRGGGNNTNGSVKLFDERIPSQVTKLSIG